MRVEEDVLDDNTGEIIGTRMVTRRRSHTDDLDEKWSEFQATFEKMNRMMVRSIAHSLGGGHMNADSMDEPFDDA